MFRQAYISKLITHNPAAYLALPKAVNGTHRSITDFEREHFLRVADVHTDGLMFKTMLYCGLRTGEVVALEWRDIDFSKRRICVSRAAEAGTDELKEPKTAAGVREVPMPDDLYKDLAARRGDPFTPVFTRPKGGRHTSMSRHHAWQSFKDAVDASMGAVYEIRRGKNGPSKRVKTLSVIAEDLVPYCLRHTYCTDLQNKGIPINIAKYLMGHANISVTSQIYTHISDVAIDNAAKIINGGNDGGNAKMITL